MTTSGAITNYSLFPSGDTVGAFSNLTVDSSNNVWFAGCAGTSTTNEDTVFGYINPSTNAVTTYVYAHTSGTGCGNSGWDVEGLAIDATGNIWILQTGGGYHISSVLGFSPSGSYRTGYAAAGSVYDWTSMTAGPNNSLWITDVDAHGYAIRQLTLDPTTDVVTGMTTHTPPTGSYPENITTGPDGNLWFADANNQAIDKMTPSGIITAYPVSSGSPYAVTTGPDGAMWFTATPYIGSTEYVDHVTTSGSMTEYAVPTTGADVRGITSGPDNAIWFTELSGGKIGRQDY